MFLLYKQKNYHQRYSVIKESIRLRLVVVNYEANVEDTVSVISPRKTQREVLSDIDSANGLKTRATRGLFEK
ncbi:hypothetical protein EIZ39_23755 [Ammoniphilus sp. CFH 90114]|nr:hypothetical protein EIZ39_23755 [Ammoniphilus sp. CFH 90114]